jgi:hypothetical protein
MANSKLYPSYIYSVYKLKYHIGYLSALSVNAALLGGCQNIKVKVRFKKKVMVMVIRPVKSESDI